MPRHARIKQFDRAECRRLADVLNPELEAVGKKLGISLVYKGARFSPTNSTIKIEAAIVGADGEVQTKEAEMFKLMARRYGLKVSDLGKPFTDWSGKTYTITGCSSRRCRTPIFVKRADGKGFRFPAEEVKALLERKKA